MVNENLIIRETSLIFKNFAGRETRYNHRGDRNVGVVIKDPEYAQELLTEGWPVHARVPKNSTDPDVKPYYYIPVKISFDRRPPKIVGYTNGHKHIFTKDDVESLDFAEIITAKVAIRPYNWDRDGRSGTSAYLKTLYVEIEGDEFEEDYADLEFPEEDDNEETPF